MQRPSPEAMQKVVQPLAGALTKAHSLTEGKKTEAFNHQKAVAESLLALTWVCYAGRDCGTALDLFSLLIDILHSLFLELIFYNLHRSFALLVKLVIEKLLDSLSWEFIHSCDVRNCLSTSFSSLPRMA